MIRWAYLKRVLAGAIFGLYMAHLLYFLNPQVDITPGRLAVVTIVYGLICGFLFGTLLWGLRALRVRMFGRPNDDGEYRAHGFGFVVFAAFVASASYFLHLHVLRDYLPIGAVRVLSKATNVITATAFLLLLIWVVERNAGRRLSRALFIAGFALIAVSSFFLYQRRESYRTEQRDVVVAEVGTIAGHRPVIVVVIRNLPYDWLITLAGEGLLPHFDQARRRDYFTRVEPFASTSPTALWASLATGKLPYRHGVTGRFSYRTPLNGRDPSERFLLLPSGVGFRAWGLIPPVQRISAPLPSGDALPLWTLFERLGFRASVVGWPSSNPRSATRVISNGALEPAAVPPLFTQRFANTRDAVGVVSALALDLGALRDARAVLRDERFGVHVVALEGFAAAQRAVHVFANELPPKATVKGDVVRAYAQQLDRIVAELQRDHPEHLLVVVSPSGVVAPVLPASAYAFARQELMPSDPGADDGFVLMSGPGTAYRDNPPAASVVDVVPTILFAAGLPVGRDMDGHILSEAFDEEFLRSTTLSVIQTYEARQVMVRRGGGV